MELLQTGLDCPERNLFTGSMTFFSQSPEAAKIPGKIAHWTSVFPDKYEESERRFLPELQVTPVPFSMRNTLVVIYVTVSKYVSFVLWKLSRAHHRLEYNKSCKSTGST